MNFDSLCAALLLETIIFPFVIYDIFFDMY